MTDESSGGAIIPWDKDTVLADASAEFLNPRDIDESVNYVDGVGFVEDRGSKYPIALEIVCLSSDPCCSSIRD